jgi:hypothetical protein
MKKNIIILLIFNLLSVGFGNAYSKDSFKRQMFKNMHIGWDLNKTNDYRWSNFNFGTAYGQRFHLNSKASWQIAADYNWSKYTLYSNAEFNSSNYDKILRTQSLSFPLTAEYRVYRTLFTNIRVYTGPVYELILSSKMDGNYYSGIKNSQLGWTLGSKIRFLGIFNARLAYNYYPTGLFSNGGLNRSAISFSVGF